MTLPKFIILAVLIAIGSAKKTFYDCGVATEEQKEIINVHNDLRLLVANGLLENQPRGINLKRMSWDAKLAEEAQKVADLGIFEHLVADDDRFAVGQNLYMWMSTASSSSGSAWTSGIEAWWKEHKNYVYGAETQNGVTGHYTQVVWANTYLVGCGYCYFSDDEEEKYPYRKLYVCNYGPAGNYVGQLPYETGESGCENLC